MNPNEEKIRQYLKKNIKVDVDKQPTKQEKEEFVKRKLFTEQTHSHTFQKKSIFEKLSSTFMNGYGYFRTRKFRLFMRDTFPFLAFFSFSTYILYKMEEQCDKMNQSVFRVKTLKEQEIEKENEFEKELYFEKNQKLIINPNYDQKKYITKALRGERFSNQENQITDVPDKRNKYKFEEVEGEEGIDFDTRDDFLEGLRKDFNQGIQIGEEYKEQVFEYAKRENKRIGFAIGLTQEDEDDNANDEQLSQTEIIPTTQPKKAKTIKRKTKKPQSYDEDDDNGFGPETLD